MKPTRLHHVSLCVTDVERARRFYIGILGLEEIERPNFPFPGAWLQGLPVFRLTTNHWRWTLPAGFCLVVAFALALTRLGPDRRIVFVG